jgi:hypothetical protein
MLFFFKKKKGDYLYVIIRGSVNVKIKKAVANNIEEQVVNVLYDGAYFGEVRK